MSRFLGISGYLILSCVVLLLFGVTAVNNSSLLFYDEIPIILVGLGLLFGIVQEGRQVRVVEVPTGEVSLGKAVAVFLAVLGAALITYTLKVDVGLGAVLAASLVGLIAGIVFPAVAVPIYCGSFVGMTSSRLLVDHSELALAGTIAAFVYLLTERAFIGFGGKLGTIAFTGTLITGLGLKGEFSTTPIPEWEMAVTIVLCSVVAVTLTYWLNVRRQHGPVVASAIVGITGGLILPSVYPEPVGATLAVMVMCASFAGMSSSARFPTIYPMSAVGFVTGCFFVYSMPLAGGAGGKLGTLAFGSAVAVWGAMDLRERWNRRQSAG